MAIDLLLNQKKQKSVRRIGDFGKDAPHMIMKVADETIFIQMPMTVMSRSTLLWDQRDFTPDSVMGAAAANLMNADGLKDVSWKGTMGAGIEQMKRGVESKIGDALGIRDNADYMAHKLGKAVNPNKELTFSGLGYRQFAFEFEIIPTTKEQSQKIDDFILTMQYYAAPDFADAANTYFQYPDIWDVRFRPHLYLPAIMPCYLTDYAINYGGAGRFVLHEDAAPLQVTISMTFTEAELHMRDKIDEGYWG